MYNDYAIPEDESPIAGKVTVFGDDCIPPLTKVCNHSLYQLLFLTFHLFRYMTTFIFTSLVLLRFRKRNLVVTALFWMLQLMLRVTHASNIPMMILTVLTLIFCTKLMEMQILVFAR